MPSFCVSKSTHLLPPAQPAEPSRHTRKCIPPTQATLHHIMTHTTLHDTHDSAKTPKPQHTTPIHNEKKNEVNTHRHHCKVTVFLFGVLLRLHALPPFAHTLTLSCTLQPTLQPQMLTHTHTHIHNTLHMYTQKNSRNHNM